MNLMDFVHVHNEFLMQSQILFCFMHNIFLYFACACVCVSFTCSTIGSCSGGFLFSTPIVSHTWNAVSCSAKKGLCCGHKTHTQCLSGFYAYTVMSQSAVTTLSYHKSPDTMSLEVTLHCSSNINLDLSWSPPPPTPLSVLPRQFAWLIGCWPQSFWSCRVLILQQELRQPCVECWWM